MPTTTVNRDDLELLKGMTPRLMRFFVDLFDSNATAVEQSGGAVAATGALQAATVLTLSPNAAFENERVVSFDPVYFALTDNGAGNALQIRWKGAQLQGGFRCTFNLLADTAVTLPPSGVLATTNLGGGPYANDSAAAAGGIKLGEIYRGPSGAVTWRQT